MNVQASIEATLAGALSPDHLEVVNESGQHNVPPDSETHFKVVVVAGEFEGRPKVARHRRVYSLLGEELAGPVHALSLHAYTPDEWARRSAQAPSSPPCLGGSKAGASG